MIKTNDLKSTLTDVASVLSSNHLKFHLTGGLASSFYGEPRFTQDIDIVIRISPEVSLDRLVSDLARRFVIDRSAVQEAVRHRRLFQALHEETMIKVDFHVGEMIEGELDRSQEEEILFGVTLPLVSKEDAILSKLIWLRRGSQKSRKDILMMLKRRGKIDFDYLNGQATTLEVQDLLNELRAEMGAEQA